MTLTLEEMIEKNRNDLIKIYKRGLELLESEDFGSLTNLNYLKQNWDGIFQYVQVLDKQITEKQKK